MVVFVNFITSKQNILITFILHTYVPVTIYDVHRYHQKRQRNGGVSSITAPCLCAHMLSGKLVTIIIIIINNQVLK